ncbi:MAG: NDP-sugar synthase [Acidimicrobiia bacterium]
MKAVVLVGGEGTRLRPLTSTVPKPLLPIAGQPFVERQLSWLARHGVDDAVLSLGYLPDAFVSHFPDGEFDGVRLRYAVEPVPLGTAGAIRFAAQAGCIEERFVVCNGDVLTTLDVSALVRFHEARGAEATIHLTRVEDPASFGVVPTFDDGEVKAFVEKPPSGTAPSDWINAGTYVLEPSVLERIPEGLAVSIERETFPRMLEERGHLFASGTDDYWIDIGTPEKYLQAHEDTLRGAVGLPPLRDAREIATGVWVQGEPGLAADAVVRAPSLLGAASVVESGARVENATIGAGCFVGIDATVKGSVLLAGARVERGATVVASIVGSDAHVGERAVVTEGSIVGPGFHVATDAHLAGERVELSTAAG